jgi:hypothetical protein
MSTLSPLPNSAKPENWLNRYIGVQYGDRPGQYKCWSLVQAVYKEQLGIDLKDYKGVDEGDLRDLIRVAREMGNDYKEPPWTVVQPPLLNFDVVIMAGHVRTKESFYRAPVHAGVFVQGRILHIQEGTDSVHVDPRHPSIRFRVIAYSRHQDLM